MAKVINFNKNGKSFERIADSKLDEGDVYGAIIALKRALDYSGNDYELLFKLAELYDGIDSIESAKKYYFLAVSAAENKEQLAEAYASLGKLFYTLNNYFVAAHYYEMLIGLGSLTVEQSDCISDFFAEMSTYTDNLSIVYPPESADYSRSLEEARSLIGQGQMYAALDLLETIPEESPLYYDALGEQAFIKFVTYGEGEDIARFVLSRDKKNIVCNSIMTSMCVADGKMAEAKKYFKVLLSAENKDYDLKKRIVVHYCEFNEHKKAIELSKELLSEDEYDGRFLHVLGIASAKLGDFAEAERYLRKAIVYSEYTVSRFALEILTTTKDVKDKKEIAKRLDYAFAVDASFCITLLVNIKLAKQKGEPVSMERVKTCIYALSTSGENGAFVLAADLIKDFSPDPIKEICEELMDPVIDWEYKSIILERLIINYDINSFYFCVDAYLFSMECDDIDFGVKRDSEFYSSVIAVFSKLILLQSFDEEKFKKTVLSVVSGLEEISRDIITPQALSAVIFNMYKCDKFGTQADAIDLFATDKKAFKVLKNALKVKKI